MTDRRRHRPAAPARPAPRARVGVFGIGLEAYWPQFDGPARAHRGLPAARRGAGRARSAARWCPPGSSTPRRRRARGGRPLRAPRRSTSCSATRSRTRRRARCCRPSRRRRCRSCCSGCSRRRRSTTRTPARASGWPTARPAACRSSRARSRARGSPTTRSPARSTTTSARGPRSRAWVRAAGVARALRRSRIGFLGHTYPGMLDMYSDFTAVHAQLGAHVEVLEIDDLGARVAARDDAEVAAKQAEIRAMFDFADPSDDPIAGPIEPEQLDWSARVAVGLDRLAARLRARRADLLLPRDRRQRGRAARRRRHRRQLAADRARDPDRGRGRPQDERRPADPRPARRRRLVHRVLRARLRRGLRPHGPRRPGARRDRRGAADAARAASSTTASAAPG